MAADLFESYAVTLVAALILGSQAFGTTGLVFPLLIPAIGALTAVLGVYLCKPAPGRERPEDDQPRLLHLRGRRAWRSIVLSFIYLPSDLREFENVAGIDMDRRRGRPAHHRLGRRGHRHRDGGRHPGP
jgi:K(+)-stimulated pyrophosphate-energized sodium pump